MTWRWFQIIYHSVPLKMGQETCWSCVNIMGNYRQEVHRVLLCLKSIFHWIFNHFLFKELSQVYCIYLLAERLQSLRNCWNLPWPICHQLDSLLSFYIQNLDAQKSWSQLSGHDMLQERIHKISYTETLHFFTNELIVLMAKVVHLRPDIRAAI